MLEPDAGLAAIVAFFGGMGQTFRAYPEQASFGCLMVNTLGELGGKTRTRRSPRPIATASARPLGRP